MDAISSFLNNKITITLMLIFYAALIFTLSGIHFNSGGNGLVINDKVIHALEYSVFGFLLLRYFFNVRSSTLSRSVILTIVFGGLYAVSDEIHQGFVGYFSSGKFGEVRDPDIFDFFADLAGLIFSCAVYTVFKLNLKNIKLYLTDK